MRHDTDLHPAVLVTLHADPDPWAVFRMLARAAAPVAVAAAMVLPHPARAISLPPSSPPTHHMGSLSDWLPYR